MKPFTKILLAYALVFTFTSIQAQVPTSGLIAWWPFTGNAIDSVKMLNNGKVTGATLSKDRFGVPNSAYDFNGNGDYIDVGNHSSLRSSTLSINFWFRYTDTTVDMFMVNNANYSNGFYGINCRHQINGGMMMDAATGGSKRMMAHRSFKRWNDGKWHMYTGMYEKNSDIIVMFIDGEISGYKNWDIAGGGFISTDSVQYRGGEHWMFGAASQFFSGTAHNGPSYFKGSLDDIRFYNRLLTPKEIRGLYYEKDVDPCDAVKVTIYDTSYVRIQDTTFVNIYDTLRTTVMDTLKMNVAWSSARQNFNLAKVYPNPTNDKVVVDFGDYFKVFGHRIFINDVLGKQVYDGTVTSRFIEVDLKSMGKSGTYIMVITDKQLNVLLTKHLILQ